MAKDLQTQLIELLSDPAAAALQADLAQAATLRHQEIALRQRAGAAAAQLRRAREEQAPPEEIVALEATLASRQARLEATRQQAEAADIRRPQPDPTTAQIFGRAIGTVEKPPVTAAALSADGKVVARAVSENGIFHLSADGDLDKVTLQLSDASRRVIYRTAEPLTVEAGQILQIDVAVGPPQAEPGPVPSASMPNLVGQSERVALAILQRLGLKPSVTDKPADGVPDIVIDQSPAPDTPLTDTTKVSLTVRRAATQPPADTMPNLVGQNERVALALLDRLGVKPAIVDKAAEGVPDIVIDQSPAPDTPLTDKTKVSLTVRRAVSTPPPTGVLPRFIGMKLAEAQARLKSLNIEPRLERKVDDGPANIVLDQKPKEGTALEKVTTVVLLVSAKAGNPVPAAAKVARARKPAAPRRKSATRAKGATRAKPK